MPGTCTGLRLQKVSAPVSISVIAFRDHRVAEPGENEFSSEKSSFMDMNGRSNQKHRTRSALVAAAVELLGTGKSPSITEVADAARVSPATAYRYFPSAHSLWRAVLLEMGEPSDDDVFEGVDPDDAEGRVAAMIRKTGWHMFDHEELWRTAARVLLERAGSPDDGDERIPVPTGRRMEWIRAALAPVEPQLSAEIYRRLCMGLALVVGTEAVITLRDVCQLSIDESKQTSLWTGQALVRAALAEQRLADAQRPRSPKHAKPSRATETRRTESRTRLARSR
jgi:AcrR family transcriptional regulator